MTSRYQLTKEEKLKIFDLRVRQKIDLDKIALRFGRSKQRIREIVREYKRNRAGNDL